MAEHAEPAVAGELVVRDGKHSGERIPLTVPVTVIGAADLCDVKLAGEGVGEVHCAISLTPAGPALRSWYPDDTLVNGEPTWATLLKDGDEIRVGPCLFQFAWHLEDLIPLTAAGEDAAPATPDATGQPADLAALIDARYRQLCEWVEELADHREELRLYRARQESYVAADKAKVRRMREQTDRLRRATRHDRMRARAVYRRFLERMKRKWSAERAAVEAERADLDRVRRELADEVARFEADHARSAAEAAAYQRRLHDAWELLTDGQRRLLADRQEAERTLAREREALDRRTEELAERERTSEAGRDRVEARVQELLAEIARLELRASHAQSVLRNLEEKRAALEGGTAPAARVAGAIAAAQDPFDGRVPLNEVPAGAVEEVMAGLVAQQHDLARERTALSTARAELERRAAELVDQRAVLAEQVAALAVARQAWQTAECRTVAELESLARGLDGRALAIENRERELDRIADGLRRRLGELCDLRAKLEGWQTALAAHEATAAAARDRAGAELIAKREHLTKWEGALAGLCRKWSAARKRDLDQLRGELARWAEAREAYAAKLADLDRQRDELAATAAHTAAASVAAEEVEQRLVGGERGRLARRKLRVHRRKWESYFAKYLKELGARREALAAEAVAAGDRTRELTRALAEAAEQRAAVTEAEQSAEADRLARGRELDERAVILSIEQARAQRTERELAEVRGEVERVAAALMGPDGMPPPVGVDDEPVLLALPARAV